MIQGIEERNYNYFVFIKNSHDLWNGIMLFKGKQDNVYFNVYCKLYGNFLKKMYNWYAKRENKNHIK